jgi:uncharacterized membrane protein
MARKQIVTRFHYFGLGILGAITVVGFNKIRAGLPVHWGYDGKPDQIWPRDPALTIFPVIAIVVTLAFLAIGWLAPADKLDSNRRGWEGIITGLLLLLCALQFAFVMIGIGSELDPIRFLGFVVAFVLLGLGATIFRAPAQVYHGLHLPWTFANRGDWLLAHRSIGGLMLLGGLALGAVAILQPDPEDILITMAAAVFMPPIFGSAVTAVLAARNIPVPPAGPASDKP